MIFYENNEENKIKIEYLEKEELIPDAVYLKTFRVKVI